MPLTVTIYRKYDGRMKRSSIDEIIKRARAAAQKDGWNKTRLAGEAGLGINGLVDLFKPDFNPTAKTLRKLEEVLDLQHPDTAGSEHMNSE